MSTLSTRVAAVSRFVVASLACLAVLSACGGSDGGDRQAKIDLLLSEGESQQSAECYVDELAGYDLSDFEILNKAETVEEVREELFDAAMDAARVCE